MKRIFSAADSTIPDSMWIKYPEESSKLKKIGIIEDKIDNILHRRLRFGFAVHSEPEVKKNILRIFLHHKYIPCTQDEKAYFLLTLEGHVLDNNHMRSLNFGSFFEKVRFQVDKRVLSQEKLLEWSEDVSPEGLKAQCFKLKLVSDKPSTIKLFLHRSLNIRPRYELSLKLRNLLPYMQVDPTEDDIMLAVWQYILYKNLIIEGRERKAVRCDELLKDITNADSVVLSTLKHKIFEHLTPAKPIQVDYNLTTTNTFLGANKFGPNHFHKYGGKSFDIEVDLYETASLHILDNVNKMAQKVATTQASLDQLQNQLLYMAKAAAQSDSSSYQLRPESDTAMEDKDLSTAELIATAADYQRLIALRKESKVSFQSSDYAYSNMHTLHTFADVGSDKLFHAAPAGSAMAAAIGNYLNSPKV